MGHSMIFVKEFTETTKKDIRYFSFHYDSSKLTSTQFQIFNKYFFFLFLSGITFVKLEI